jgi:salicylate hydroxylase
MSIHAGRHAIVAGAGIGGLTASLYLARAGFHVSILERAPVLEEAGAGLQIPPNASRILADLGVLEPLQPLALQPQNIRIRRGKDGADLAHLSLADAEARWGAPYLVAHRADLHRVLLDRVALEPSINLHLDRAVAGCQIQDEQVQVGVRRGLLRLSETADLLIGADGLHSAVRARMFAQDALIFSGRTAWRGLIDARTLPAALRYPESNLWLGVKQHLVHYAIRGGRYVNVVAIIDESWTAAPDPDSWNTPGDASILATRFGQWHQDARSLLAAVAAWRKWPLYERPPLPGYAQDQVALLGDAAHPMMPFLAQGAAMAIEDAAALGQALQSERDIPTALKSYNDKRLQRTHRVQQEAKNQARIYHLSGIAAFARDAGMRMMGQRLLKRYDWLYRF